MEVAGNNVFSLEGYPFVETTWLSTTVEKTSNCRLEEVTLQSECPNCTISSPLGDVPGAAAGSFHHNLVTLVWDDTWKETKPCQLRIVEQGKGVRFTEANATSFRVRDPHKQLDFIYLPINISVCSLPSNLSNFHAVLGMEKVAITVLVIPDNSKNIPIVRNAQAVDAFGKTIQITSHLTRAEIEYASHTQYSRDLAMEVSNHLAKEIRTLQCEHRRATHQAAISTAQYNGWLAAAYLDLPLCTKLIAVGESAAILRCAPRNITFEPIFTNCGPQPRFNNYTINNEGWELTKYSECYWHANFVNFNGKAHTFRNNTWAPVEPNIQMHGRRLIDTMPLEVDNSFGTLLEMHPAITSHPLSSSTIMADILAYIQMGYTSDLSGDRHVETIFVHPSERNSVSFMARLGNWIRNFGILSGIGMTIALAFRFCGLGSLLGAYIPCLRFCNPFSWLATMPSPSRDVEAGVREVHQTAPPVTIVNIPSPNYVDLIPRANAIPDLDVLRKAEPRRGGRQEPIHREDVHLLQAHQR